MGLIRWIVVGVDFSNGSIRALEYALEQASATGASVACVHVYEDAPSTPILHDAVSAILNRLDAVIAPRSSRRPGVRVDSIVRRGAAWVRLADVATELGAELIVVGADGERGASGDGFLGTVANRLATKSSQSVVVVPSRAHADHRS